MKTTGKTMLAVLALSVASASFAFGPGPHKGCGGGGGPRGEMGFVMMEEALNLTAEQTEAIRQIKTRMFEERQDFRGQQRQVRIMDLDPTSPTYNDEVNQLAEQKAERMKERMQRQAQYHAEMYAILTPEQQATLKELRQKAQTRAKQRNW
ncbi:Spy/CpxP family protein refolding chaperone [Teredinibacter sp. KSP-S5-2]|uniref:Spy/CpxP family protein refolding chaperone n=1 Tax=Teredinibacter sp. KSP-S5-2 TaxID=3034506 RepID=UPI00293416E3|nr:Spy/CpxP family protein refolding chaperone [Teredinibacter sp. KSP-S5-2]WNO08473.1 Spy/CpxP family protein refolding chaperone [Teredinibacter sp. KSP-S5-2]